MEWNAISKKETLRLESGRVVVRYEMGTESVETDQTSLQPDIGDLGGILDGVFVFSSDFGVGQAHVLARRSV